MADRLAGCLTIPAAKLHDWQVIGGGSFGDIFKARHEDWRDFVAVKKLNSNFSHGLEELFSEASKMDRASSITYVIKLYGIYESKVDNGSVCHGIVMEYLENGSLASLLHRVQPVPPALKIRILHEVALGMNRLHDLHPPLLHLDLKPSNVLLDSELHVRIADFGLSRFKRGSSFATGTAENYGGTLEYMPPEGLKEDVNYRPTQVFDVYSYGILIWAVLTGQEPYSAASPEIIRMRIPLGDRPDMNLLKAVDSVEKVEELKELMQLCWHQDPSERPVFKVCLATTEMVLSVHKADIIPSVRKVQDILMKMVTHLPEDLNSRRSYAASNRVEKTSMAFSTATSDSHMSQLVEEFQTMRFMEGSSQNLGAVPLISASVTPTAATTSEHPTTPKPHVDPRFNGESRQAWCQSSNPNPYHHTGNQHDPCRGWSPNPYHPFMYNPLMYHPQYSYPPYASLMSPPTGSTSISGSNLSGIQIGNNNSMTIVTSSTVRKGKKKKN
ncbi:receptor-interacting serine/threonine-protein kinase 3 isoform X2 [Ambystoma mexicanum]|uniref:receptor-interacting serine/threonine-protein kinase 3 isoform X2 n=1 Tax=Ambystoma mexicanum TaxID=8296 RepID=UPI0037E7D596